MILFAKVQRDSDDEAFIGTGTLALHPERAETAQRHGAQPAVLPGLCFDGGDGISRGGARVVFEKHRRADHIAVVQHGDDVARVLPGESQHRMAEIAVMHRLATVVPGDRMAQCVKRFVDFRVVHRIHVAAKAQHGDHADHQHDNRDHGRNP